MRGGYLGGEGYLNLHNIKAILSQRECIDVMMLAEIREHVGDNTVHLIFVKPPPKRVLTHYYC